jgi:hypothetical protein
MLSRRAGIGEPGRAGAFLLALCCLAPAGGTVTTSLPTRREMFEVLTRTSWCDRERWKKRREPRPLYPDFTEWELRADGTYHWELFTDFTPSPRGSGQWTLEQAQGAWVLVLSTGERHHLALAPDETLTINLNQYWACRPLKVDTPYSQASLPPIRLPDRVNAIRDAVVGTEWRRTNDMDLDFRPTSVRFNRDWTYVSAYRNGECRNPGTWYATSKVHGHAAANACDLRNPAYPEILGGELSADGLLLGQELYVGAGSELRNGTVWFSEHGEIRLEYGIPIRRGQTTTFTLYLSNGSAEPLNLRRFAITSEHVPNYRDAQNRVVPASSELAAKELQGQALAAGERTAVSLDVVFDRPVKEVYFHLLTDRRTLGGRTQASDMTWLRSIRVQE